MKKCAAFSVRGGSPVFPGFSSREVKRRYPAGPGWPQRDFVGSLGYRVRIAATGAVSGARRALRSVLTLIASSQ
ncbi:hypothetical protein Airi02_023530 [Actinoallomurus iriomotensis]|uniref:Uncharacterized protein n=1 Tax=Actinoallomurus iriomotensis TaxID=478107 RepID=A0A9W6RZ22_9ACTN|nr:hypothetical protein Airi02_023530 [Actinoallomurus iriomotensis]